KIDLPSARPEEVAEEIEQILGYPAEECIYVSAKTGQGIDELIWALCDRLPRPKGDPKAPARGLIFDSHYDDYRGVVVYVRMFDGRLDKGQKIQLMGNGREFQVSELGKFMPRPTRVESIGPGEVRSEEHTSELQSRENLVCRLLLEKKNRTRRDVL